MNMKCCMLVVAMAAMSGFAGGVPKSVTKGAATTVPSFDKLPFVQEGEAAAIAIPTTGWKIDWQRECPKGSNDVTGLAVEATEVELRGVKTPAIRITCTSGKFKKWPLVTLDMPMDFTEWNILSFSAKVEYPEGSKPLMLDSSPMIGWYSGSFFDRWDDFGIAADDGLTYPWAGGGVHTTDFKYHDYPVTRTKDGFTDFRWDVPHEERTGYKGFLQDHVKSLYFMYDTKKIKEGQKVVITIADMKLVKGWHKKYDHPDRYAAWLKRVQDYKPDLSDSSKYLEPPAEGRLGMFSKIRLAKGGVAQAEIVVDVSDDLKLDNYFKGEKAKMLEIRTTRGREHVQARAAAYELARWLKELTGGAEFPVVSAPTDADNVKIFLGPGFAKEFYADDLKALAEADGGVDGFAVRNRGGNVYIFGAHPMGTMNGVHAFVENNSDLIWAMADDPDGTVFTVDPDLAAVWADAREIPAFIIRGWQGGSEEWKRCNRSNFQSNDPKYGFALNGGHYLSPQYYEPCEGIQDYNAMIKGERKKPWSEYRQLCCLADPDFQKRAFTILPNVQETKYRGSFHTVFGTDDNCGVCECPKCTAPIKTIDGKMLTPDLDYQAYYGAWFYSYLNKMDDAIQKVCPGFMTSTYAYFFACSYPPIKLNKTIVPWLCAYYRKAYNEPIYSPANQDWYRIYKDWMKHSKGIYLYDYYGLGMRDAPIAEVYQEDLRAQRDIGFLRTSTEGFGYNQYCGCGDERWVMARLAWNPDADVEQLHRYFNRRTYREAAPWIDRYRGVIRDNWYKNFRSCVQLNETYETFQLIKMMGLEKELAGYLDEAQKAVKNPHAKKLLEKLVTDFRFGLTNKEWYATYPSGKGAAKPKKENPAPTAADVAFKARMAEAVRYSKLGNYPSATNEFLIAMGDRLVEPKLRRSELNRVLPQIVVDTLKINGKQAMTLYRQLMDDGFAKAYGFSVDMNYSRGAAVNALADAFVRRGSPAEAPVVFDMYINWDGNQLPPGLRMQRVAKKIDFMRAKKMDVSRHLGAYVQALKACAGNTGCSMSDRGDAMLRLLKEEMEKKSVDERLKDLFAVIDDRFMLHRTRFAATKMIPDVCTVDGKTDWAKVSEATLKALSAGDWSGQWRNTYWSGNGVDLRLDALLDVSAKMVKAEEKALAATMLVKGATAIGYTKDVTAQKLDIGRVSQKDFDKRLKKLDDAMAALGVARQ